MSAWWVGLASLLSLYSPPLETGGLLDAKKVKRWPTVFTKDYDVFFIVPVIYETPGVLSILFPIIR